MLRQGAPVIDRDALTAALQKQLAAVEADLRERSDDPDLPWAQALRAEYEAARDVGRTGWSWSQWRDGVVAQAGVAWVLAAVFVRFCEDNDLIDRVFIAAPGSKMVEATDAETAFYAADPNRNARDWLREAFTYLGSFKAAAGLVDQHNPVWTAPLGADACREVLTFWREQDADGSLTWSLADPGWDTRFLGDLYQDLSEHAKKQFALLQTPDFVEEFILSRTLTPALEQVPLEELRLIDPTCGSGHFLLGAFEQIHEEWLRQAPGMDARVRVAYALGAVHGVDINPFAVAVARFRLTLAAMRACGATTLARAPDFRPRVAVGDSLLAGNSRIGKQGEFDLGEDDPQAALAAHRYAAEDVDEFPGILERRSYHVVVGNPPYITIDDAALNAAYRSRYQHCYREFALTVPFMELFFDLATRGNGGPAGWVGQITSNSFMKREFGSKLIEQMLSGADPLNPVDLLDVIDTSGAYIPGHGTPTVIIIGRRRRPSGDTVHAVLGVRGEPGQPQDASKGLVWTQIVEHIDDPEAFDGEYVTVTDLPQDTFAVHPWSLTGGAAADVRAIVEVQPRTLSQVVQLIGYTGQTNADDVFLAPAGSFATHRVEADSHRQVVIGEVVRDFTIGESDHALFLYGKDGLVAIEERPGARKRTWPYRTNTWNRRTFAKKSYRDEGRTWWEWHQVALDRLRTPLSIAFAFVATHNHFVLDRGGKVFNRSAPVIKLPEDATLDDHLGLLAVLNSSVACFWLKQVSHNKGVGGIGGGIGDEEWEPRYEFTGTKLQEFPLPPSLPADYGRILDELAQDAADFLPAAFLAAYGAVPSRASLDEARTQWESTRRRLVAWQEELDWHTYLLYGLIDEDLTFAEPPEEPPFDVPALPEVVLGERAFEIVLARRMEAGDESSQWFTRHGSTPITEIPAAWPPEYRDVMQRRLDAIATVPAIALLERPEFKRRWAGDSWESMETAALTSLILDRLEAPDLWSGPNGPQAKSVAQLADAVRHDEVVQAAIDLLFGRDADRVKVLGELLAEECVPFAAAWRYKPSGLVKRAEWEAVWELQRREDAGEDVGSIAVPPKYGQGDFRKPSYWKLRGKLDVPKERFIAYPGAERGADTSAVFGWAGWDHAEQAQSLAAMLIDRADVQGWQSDQVLPLLAGLVELEPWLRQWHNQVDPTYGTSVADDITAIVDARLAAAGLTRADALAWRPPEPRRGRRTSDN